MSVVSDVKKDLSLEYQNISELFQFPRVVRGWFRDGSRRARRPRECRRQSRRLPSRAAASSSSISPVRHGRQVRVKPAQARAPPAQLTIYNYIL